MNQSTSFPISFLLIAIAPANPSVAAQFVGLGDLTGGGYFSEAEGVSEDGRVVVGRSKIGEDEFRAFRWTSGSGQIEALPLAAGDMAPVAAYGVSGDGSVVVGRLLRLDGSSDAFRWTASEGSVGLGQTTETSIARDISKSGNVVAGFSTGPNVMVEAFRWTEPTGMIGIGDLPGSVVAGDAHGVSADGDTIVGSGLSENGGEAFSWTPAGGFVGLGSIGLTYGKQFYSIATEVSADGQVVVGSSSSAEFQQEAFRWSPSTGMIGLGVPFENGLRSDAFGVNGDGSVIVGSVLHGELDFEWTAFIWDPYFGMRDLRKVLIDKFGLASQLADWKLEQANDISSDGLSIAGRGINPNGNTEAWLVRLDRPLTAPEPSSLALLLSVAALLATGDPGCRQMQSFRRDRS